MRSFPPLLLILAVPFAVQAQPLEGGARSVGLAGATTALTENPWGTANPASWSTHTAPAVAAFVSEAYGLPALRLGALQMVWPLPAATLAAGARSFGYEEFREVVGSVGAARGFALGTSRRLHLGVQVQLYQVRIQGYGRARALGLSAGGLVALTPTLVLGFHAHNFNAPTLAGHPAFERTLAIGLSYQVATRVLVLADLYKEIAFPVSFRAGVEVQPASVLYLRTGVAHQPTRWTVGLGVRLRALQADLGFERHEVLGWSPAASFAFSW